MELARTSVRLFADDCADIWDRGAVPDGKSERECVVVIVAQGTVRRRSRQAVSRPRVVQFSLTEEEFAEVSRAAERLGLARGAFAAEAALASARGVPAPAWSPAREALVEVMTVPSQLAAADDRPALQQKIAAEAALDGIYVIRTSVTGDTLSPAGVITAYKDLKYVERDFRITKADDLDLRPIHHYLAERVRGHVLICMLACYLTWHLRQALAELTFTDPDITAPADPVAPARL